jgi:hypothetical protein
MARWDAPGSKWSKKPGRRTQFTPEEAKARRAEQVKDRLARARAQGPRDCKVLRCQGKAALTSDYCSVHLTRKSDFGHPLAKPLHPEDHKRMVRRFIQALKVAERKPDSTPAQLIALATLEVGRVIQPEHYKGRLADELRRLQHPEPSPLRSGRGTRVRLKDLPVTPREALVTAVSAYLVSSMPGAITRSRFRGQPLPRFDNERSIQTLIGGSVLHRRQYTMRERWAGGKLVSRKSMPSPATAKRELGRQLMAVLSRLIPMFTLLVQQAQERSLKAQRATAKAKLTRSPQPVPTTETAGAIPSVPEEMIS